MSFSVSWTRRPKSGEMVCSRQWCVTWASARVGSPTSKTKNGSFLTEMLTQCGLNLATLSWTTTKCLRLCRKSVFLWVLQCAWFLKSLTWSMLLQLPFPVVVCSLSTKPTLVGSRTGTPGLRGSKERRLQCPKLPTPHSSSSKESTWTKTSLMTSKRSQQLHPCAQWLMSRVLSASLISCTMNSRKKRDTQNFARSSKNKIQKRWPSLVHTAVPMKTAWSGSLKDCSYLPLPGLSVLHLLKTGFGSAAWWETSAR